MVEKSQCILIYTPVSGPRTLYAFEVIFSHILQISFTITHNLEEFKACSLTKMNYSEDVFDDSIFIEKHPFIEEDAIRKFEPETVNFAGFACPFPVNNPKSIFSFDIFSATVYLTGRYEEYLGNGMDAHGRFLAEKSFAFRHHFLKKPLVNIWAELLREKLLKKYPDFVFPALTFRSITTVDVDMAFLYKGKGLYRGMGSMLKKLLKLNIGGFLKQFSVIFLGSKDPYDIFQELEDFFNAQQQERKYFFLLGDLSTHDRSLSFKNHKQADIIRRLSKANEVGIHPSYLSHQNEDILRKEIQRLKKITDRKVKISRFHFLKMKMPESYQSLIRYGIQEDYTMIYASEIGFRASICTPYPFFDPVKNEQTNLMIYPTMAMDVSLKDYLRYRPEQAKDILEKLIDEVKNVNGTWVSLWHNESLSGFGDWKAWKEVFFEMIKMTSREH